MIASEGVDMGWVVMSERELRRAEVLTSVVNGHLTATAAADAPFTNGITERPPSALTVPPA